MQWVKYAVDRGKRRTIDAGHNVRDTFVMKATVFHRDSVSLGPEISRYRPRPAAEMSRALGISLVYYYGGPLIAALLSLYLSMPVIFLAEHMGAVAPFLKDPAWGPLLIGWYFTCLLALLWLMYVLPRRVHLAIHQDGFVFQKLVRRHAVRFRDIVTCHVISSSGTLQIVLVDGTRFSWRNFLIGFPPEAIAQLLSRIEVDKNGPPDVSDLDEGLKRRFRLAGLVMGLVICAIVVLVPVCNADCREVIRKAFGAVFCGLPCEISVPIFMGLLFVPLVFVFPHLMILQGRRMGLRQFTTLYSPAEIRKAWKVAIAGGIYFLLLVAAWIVYSSLLGI